MRTETDHSHDGLTVHARRRARLMDRLGEGAAIVIVSNPVRNRSNDTNFDYRPNSDLWYLTGFEEPDSVLVLLPGHGEHPFVMFLRERDHDKEIWDGARLGVERAKSELGANAAYSIDKLDEYLPKLIAGRERLVYSVGHDESMDRRVIRAVKSAQFMTRRTRPTPETITEPAGYLHELRLIKSADEIDALRRAVRISGEGHKRAMMMTRAGRTEYEIQAEIEYVFKQHGAKSPGYPSIVGTGVNACVLHYIENSSTLLEGDLLLVDAGAEVGYYTGDITRTWPVSGQFSGYQREIYDLVLRSQMDVIRMVRPGVEWKALHETAVHTITSGLIDMGILEGSVDEAIEQKTFRKYFMHGTGHWLGIDVHDVGTYSVEGTSRRLEAGMAFTVEPGIYFHPDVKDAPGDYRGIGVRIEDDILVTEDGCEVLSDNVPKEPEAVEELVGSAS